MEFIEQIDPKEHDAFVSSHPLCNLLQSSAWAKVKYNWNHKIVGVKENNVLIASALVLIKPLPLSFTILYMPRGPILDYENLELVSFFFSQWKAFAKRHHAIYTVFDPAIHCNDYTLDEVNDERYETMDTILSYLKQNGAIFKGFTKHIDETIQPRFHANVVLNDDFEQGFTKSGRKSLSIAQKKKIEMRRYGIDGVEAFAHVMHATEERKQISLRDAAYFTNLMEAYGDNAFLCLAILPLQQLYEECKKKLDQVELDLENCPEHAKKKRFTLQEQTDSLTREVRELSQNIEIHGKEVAVAGGLCVKFGSTAELLYAGMNDTFKRYMAPYLTFYTCMKWSFEQGCDSCNMGGIEGDLKGGLTKFKANFHPVINEYIGEFVVLHHRWMYKILMYLLERKKRGKHA